MPVARLREPYDWNARRPESPASPRRARPPPWDWTVAVEGSLARGPDDRFVLKETTSFGTVPRMARPQASIYPAPPHARDRERARTRVRRLRRLVVAVFAAAVVVPVLVLVLDSADTAAPVPVPPAEPLLAAGPPHAPGGRVPGRRCGSTCRSPRARVTAVGYHAVGEGALALEPGRYARRTPACSPACSVGSSARTRRHPLLPHGWQRRPGDRGPRRRRPRREPTCTRRSTARSSGSRTASSTASSSACRIDIQPSGEPGPRRVASQPRSGPGADSRLHRGSRADEDGQRARSLRGRDVGARGLHAGSRPARHLEVRPGRQPVGSLPRILFVADVFGVPGRRAVETRLPELRHELGHRRSAS